MVTRVLDTVLDRALLGYGNVGYAARSRGWAPVPRMDGKVVLVTGAKAGLGRAIVEGLLSLGATVRILVRGDAPRSAATCTPTRSTCPRSQPCVSTPTTGPCTR